MGFIIADFINDDAFYKGPPTLVEANEGPFFLWEAKVSTATWFATKQQAARVARSLDKFEDREDEPLIVISIAEWLKGLQNDLIGASGIDANYIQKEIDAIQRRIKTGKAPAIPAERVALHRKSK